MRSDGRFGDGRHRKLDPGPCTAWEEKARLVDETWEIPILAQLSAIDLDQPTIAAVVAALGSTQRPITIDRARIDRELREAALAHATDTMSDEAYLARVAELRARRSALDERATGGVPAHRAVEWLRALSATWHSADLPEAKGDLVHAIYKRITVAGREIVSARLTPSAYGHGLALALPKVVMARPTGFKRADAITIRVPIEGAGMSGESTA